MLRGYGMAAPGEKLAQSLTVLKTLQDKGVTVIQSKALSRTHKDRLVKNGFLEEVIKGWYIITSPHERSGDSTVWYVSYWHFVAAYLQKKFKEAWCLSPEQSLLLHVGNWTVPKQLLARSPKGNNKIILFPHKTSILDVTYAMPKKTDIEMINQLRVFSVESALIFCAPRFFMQNPADARAALLLIRDASDILRPLLEGGHSTVAGRLAGAFRNVGRDQIANDIIKTMRAADYDVREHNPFDGMPIIISLREKSPYVNRMRILWQSMRDVVLTHFPKPPTKHLTVTAYLKQVAATYVTDAYHSLSIEGYLVNLELIERVRSGKWNPDSNEHDHEHRSALAARGYWLAFKAVEKSIQKVLKGENAGKIFDADHGDWYRALFLPSVTTGIVKAGDLAGYRNHPVYIRNSMHVPPNSDAVRDLMPAFCELLCEEKEAAVRIVLGHFFFVNIHPYMDGNGRMGRFLMNLMMAAGNYPWLVIPVEQRNQYMNALEAASTQQNIKPFTQFLAKLMSRHNSI